MRRYFPFIIVATVALLTIGGGTWLYQTKKQAAPATVKKERTSENPAEQHALGPSDAPVTLEEFGDFQCPPCGALSEPINQLAQDFPRLRIVYRNYPLAVHKHATEAARAAEAAGLQGQFWKMHDLLYREQNMWSKATEVEGLFASYAGTINCDVERFKKDMASVQVTARIQSDQHDASKVGVTTTPTIFINNTVVPPTSLHPQKLRELIEAAMKETKPNGSG